MIITSTEASTRHNKKMHGPAEERRKITWSPLLTTVAVLLLICARSLPENFNFKSIAELLVAAHKCVSSAKQAKSIPNVVSQPFQDIWDEPKSSKELFRGDTKIIWAYWDKGVDGMPDLCKHSVESWKVRNPNWRVIILDDDNYQEYVSVSDLPSTFFSLKVQHRSDLLRLAVLLRYGGAYMDASTVLFKGFDGIWDTIEDDKLMLTSLNKLPGSNLDLFNNGLLMAKGTNNKALKLWQERMLDYTEAPSLSLEAMKLNPIFSRVANDWDDPSLGMLADMVPYHSNLWMLDDLIWNNDDGVADHVVHLPKLRWGFWFISYPYLVAESQKQRKINPNAMMIDPTTDPEMVSWQPMTLLKGAVGRVAPLAFQDDPDMALRLMENTVAIKFTSHDLNLMEWAMDEFGLEHTLGYLYRGATNTTLYPIQQATLDGARPPTLAATAVLPEEVQ